MLIIGETINTSLEDIGPAVDSKDSAFIKNLAQKQFEAGADYISVNCGTFIYDEPEIMAWLIETVQEQVEVPVCIDSANPKAFEVGLPLIKNGRPMVDSVTAEKQRFQSILPLVLKYNAKVIALCMDDSGIPEKASDRIKIAERLVKDLTSAGVKIDDIYLDPIVKPLSIGDRVGVEVLETTRGIREMFPEVHISCGLSNVSHGLPNKEILNHTFMIQTMTVGMDAYILNVLDKRLMGYLYASLALLGKDKYCKNYLTAHRNGLYNL
jgi:cobalamin-dependent methionine synthase I